MNLFDYEPARSSPRMTRRVLRGFDPQAFSQIRRESQISVPDLARLADVGQSTLYAWEAGTFSPQVDLLARVMRIIDAPIERVVNIPADKRFPGDWRVIKGLTQPQLAAAAKIATTTLRGIERADLGLPTPTPRSWPSTSGSASRSTAPPTSAPGSAPPARLCDQRCKFSKHG